MERYIDIGVNLFDRRFEGRQEEILAQAKEQDVAMIITGCSLKDSRLAETFVNAHEGVYSTAGVHPHGARYFNQDTKNTLSRMIAGNPRIVAVGECGLDYDRMFSEVKDQRYAFEQQIEIAEQTGKPLFLHERSAETDFYKILKNHREICKRAVVHCFTGTKETAMRYLGLGCYIGITGWICDSRRNQDLLGALKVIPLERLMLETDSPYLVPREAGKDRTNYPWNMRFIAARVAAEKGLEEEQVITTVRENTKQFFGI